MPGSQMTTHDVAPDPVMVALAVAAFATAAFVIDEILPVVPVERDSYKYPVYDASHLVDDVAIERAIGNPANVVHFNRTYSTGNTERIALKSDLPREILAQSSSPGSVENQRQLTIATRLKIGQEKKLKAKLVALTGQATPSTKWDAASGVTIKKNIDAAKKLFRAQNGGIDPNVILIPYDVAVVMSNDSDIIARDKRTTNESLTSGQVLPSQLFGMRVVIGGAMSKLTPAAAFANIWDTDDVWLLYVDPTTSANGGDVMTFGARFRAPVDGVPVWAAKWPDADVSARKDWYGMETNEGITFIAETCALRIDNVLT